MVGIGNIYDEGLAFIGENPLGTAVGSAIGGAVVGSTVTGLIMAGSKRKRIFKSRNFRKRNRRIKHTKRGWSQDRQRRSKQRWEVAYQKRKKLRRKIYYTKKGQPYKILPNGRAIFIKKTQRRYK